MSTTDTCAKGDYEIHVTVPPAKFDELEKIAERLEWSLSAIEGDPTLGKGLRVYLTRHEKEFPFAVMMKDEVLLALSKAGIIPMRAKIELTVFDQVFE